MNKMIAILMIVLSTILFIVSFVMAPDAFEQGGYLHHAMVHLADIIGTLMFIAATKEILR